MTVSPVLHYLCNQVFFVRAVQSFLGQEELRQIRQVDSWKGILIRLSFGSIIYEIDMPVDT